MNSLWQGQEYQKLAMQVEKAKMEPIIAKIQLRRSCLANLPTAAPVNPEVHQDVVV